MSCDYHVIILAALPVDTNSELLVQRQEAHNRGLFEHEVRINHMTATSNLAIKCIIMY